MNRLLLCVCVLSGIGSVIISGGEAVEPACPRVINVSQKLGEISDLWLTKVVAEFNDSRVKLIKMNGKFKMHKHDDRDELFFVITGVLKIQLRTKTLEIHPGELVVIPKGVEHFPMADSEVSALLINNCR